jgi:hypothetical protein
MEVAKAAVAGGIMCLLAGMLWGVGFRTPLSDAWTAVVAILGVLCGILIMVVANVASDRGEE